MEAFTNRRYFRSARIHSSSGDFPHPIEIVADNRAALELKDNGGRIGVNTYDKRDIALRQLETALSLFANGHDLFSVITLAGAAEEIYGRLLIEAGRTSALDDLTVAATRIYQLLSNAEIGAKHFAERANRARNSLKHHTAGHTTAVTLDLRVEAVDLLDRAITNYWRLEGSLTDAMKRFTAAQIGHGTDQEPE